MTMRYCIELKNKKNFFPVDLNNRVKRFNANVIDLEERVYVTGVAPYNSFSAVLEICLAFGVVQCEVGIERKEQHRAPS